MSTPLRVVEMFPDDPVGHLREVNFDAAYLNGFVGGHLEHVTLARWESEPAFGFGFGLWVHDEGRLLGLPRNELATDLYRRSRGLGPVTDPFDPADIRGPAVLVCGPDLEGDDVSVSAAVLDVLIGLGMTIVQEVP